MITVRSFGCAQDDAGGVALRMTWVVLRSG
jgi:hypothetical protein